MIEKFRKFKFGKKRNALGFLPLIHFAAITDYHFCIFFVEGIFEHIVFSVTGTIATKL